MSWLKEALEWCGEVMKKGEGAHGKLQVYPVDTGLYAIVGPDGKYTLRKMMPDIGGEVPITGIDGVVDFVKACPYQGTGNTIFVHVGGLGVSVFCEGDVDLNLADLKAGCGLRLSWTARFLDQSVLDENWKTVPEMIRLMKTSPLFAHSEDRERVIGSLDKIKWTVTDRTENSGEKTSRASYGRDVQEVIETDNKEAMPDVKLTGVNLFDDASIPITEDVMCFWEYDFSAKRIQLTPYGRQMSTLRRHTMEWIESFLESQLEDVDTSVIRGSRT